MRQWSRAVDALGTLILRVASFVAVLLVAIMPLWVWVTVGLGSGRGVVTLGQAVVTGAVIAFFVLPALVSGTRVVSYLRQDPTAATWPSFWGFYRRNYVSACRLGVEVGAIVLAGWVFMTQMPGWWLAAVPALLVTPVLLSHQLAVEAHVHLTLGREFTQAAYLTLRRPGVSAVLLLGYLSLAVVCVLVPALTLLAPAAVCYLSNTGYWQAVRAAGA